MLAQGAQSVRQLTPKIVENHDCAVTFSSFVFSRPCFVVVLVVVVVAAVAAVAVVVVLFLLSLLFLFVLFCAFFLGFCGKRTAETTRERKNKKA